MRAIVADDEELARASLIRVLGQAGDVEIVGEAANGIEAVERVEALRPDVLFLDIEMPGLNGFEVLGSLRTPPVVVFVTAYDEYAVKAFEASALDYLLKPIAEPRVLQALGRVRAALARERAPYEQALRSLLAETSRVSRLAVRKGKRIVLVPLREIAYIAIDDTLVFVHSGAERYLSDKTISELEQLLAGAGFFRINRGELINLEHARELIPWFSGTWRVKLDGGPELEVSRERARELKQRMGM